MTEEERSIALHEAGHATMAICQGLTVTKARRWSPDPRIGGQCFMSYWEMDKDLARKWALVLLAGPGMADQELPEWPLDPDAPGDEGLLAAFVDYLGLSKAQYYGLEAEMWKTTTTDVFCNLFTAVTGFFEYFPTLDARMLRSAAQIATEWEGDRQ